jgi:hypothetical protein
MSYLVFFARSARAWSAASGERSARAWSAASGGRNFKLVLLLTVTACLALAENARMLDCDISYAALGALHVIGNQPIRRKTIQGGVICREIIYFDELDKKLEAYIKTVVGEVGQELEKNELNKALNKNS